MPAPSIDLMKVRELYDEGLGVTAIAEKLGYTKGGVSKALKRMNLSVTSSAIIEAPKYEAAQDQATTHLLYLAEKAKAEVEWIETSIPPKDDAEYREWQNQKLKFCAELRKLISAVGDIGYKLFQVKEVQGIIKEIVEEIGKETPECQRRIYERLKKRRDIRFPIELD